MPQPHLGHGKAAGRQALACAIHNKIQKSPVNPLTRHASRSVMGDNYQSLQVEGPAAISDPLPDRTAHQTAGRFEAFSAGDQQVGPMTSGVA
jgi:hypothetical protein